MKVKTYRKQVNLKTRENRMKSFVRTTLMTMMLLAMTGLIAGSAVAYDDTEANYCGSCHFFPGSAVMTPTVADWFTSGHGNSSQGYNQNTYCANCHSPFQADAAAHHDTGIFIPDEEWQNITCATCHPPHNLRVEWGTPVATYDVASAEYTPIYEGELDAICLSCHTGSRHSKEFAGFGQAMFEHKGVECVDCHMPAVPNDLDPGRMTMSHTFSATDNVAYSCGTVAGGCHSVHKPEWAVKQIAKDKIHGKTKTNSGGGGGNDK
jgi:formate-dependent nitrite reductase cytochrome c552 subunit